MWSMCPLSSGLIVGSPARRSWGDRREMLCVWTKAVVMDMEKSGLGGCRPVCSFCWHWAMMIKGFPFHIACIKWSQRSGVLSICLCCWVGPSGSEPKPEPEPQNMFPDFPGYVPSCLSSRCVNVAVCARHWEGFHPLCISFKLDDESWRKIQVPTSLYRWGNWGWGK